MAATWIQTYAGVAFRYEDLPDPALIDPRDIAHALAHLCRFTGHTSRFYSVAEHSVLVWMRACEANVPRHVRQWALLHDAGEAYVGDLNTALKSLLGPAFERWEHKVLESVRQRFGLPTLLAFQSEWIKTWDLEALVHERAHLFGPAPMPWQDGLPRDPWRGRVCMLAGNESPWEAKAEFWRAMKQENLV